MVQLGFDVFFGAIGLAFVLVVLGTVMGWIGDALHKHSKAPH